ncbi:MAG: hypothetical protein V3U76_01880 [Granulosicoccus sp.]
MNKMATLVVIALLSGSTSIFAQSAEDATEACNEAARLIAKKDIDGALEEARWCVESLQQMKQQQTLAVMPDEVKDFVGGDIEENTIMGMTMIERSYTRDDETIKVSMTSGAASGALAGLTQMALGMGGGGKKMRIQKRTVVDMSEADGKASFVVQLKSGGMLTIGSDELSPEAVLPFIKAFPIIEIDDAMR